MDRARQKILRSDPSVDGSGVRVAVLDTGIDAAHPDLREQLDEGSSCSVSVRNDLVDRNGHGTHVAGIIGGDGSCSDGKYRGIAPGVEIVAVKISSNRRTSSANVLKAIEVAVKADVDIINYSAGQNGSAAGEPPWKWPRELSRRDKIFRKVVEEHGILCVAAAGNSGPEKGTINRPAAVPAVLGVGETNRDGQVAKPSSRGPVYVDPELRRGQVERLDERLDDVDELRRDSPPKPDVVAPGGRENVDGSTGLSVLHRHRRVVGMVSCYSRSSTLLESLDPGGKERYTAITGSSQATAVISGLAALLLEYGRREGMDWGDNEAVALREIIREAAQPLADGGPHDFGNGIPLWPHVAVTLEDCVENDLRRETVLEGPQIKLLDEE